MNNHLKEQMRERIQTTQMNRKERGREIGRERVRENGKIYKILKPSIEKSPVNLNIVSFVTVNKEFPIDIYLTLDNKPLIVFLN